MQMATDEFILKIIFQIIKFYLGLCMQPEHLQRIKIIYAEDYV